MIDKIKKFIMKPFCDMTVKEKILDILVTLSLSLIIVFGFSSCSKLNAEEITYYDWEKVEVSELPEASDSTLDKVYVVNDKYYITNKVENNGSLILNHNYKDEMLFCPSFYDKTFASSIISDSRVSSLNVGDSIFSGVFGDTVSSSSSDILLKGKYSNNWWMFNTTNNGDIPTYITNKNTLYQYS